MGRHGNGQSATSWHEVHPFTPEKLRAMVQASKRALGVTTIDLWQFHHANAFEADDARYADLMKAAKELIDSGDVKAVGLCNCSVKHIEVALRYCPIRTVQNEFNLWDQRALKGKASGAKSNQGSVLPFCAENGILFMPYGVFGGKKARDKKRNLAEDFPDVAAMAKSKGVSPHAVVLAWIRHQFPCVLHIIGFRHSTHLESLRMAAALELTETEVIFISSLKPKKH